VVVMVDKLDKDCNVVHGHDSQVQKMRVNMCNTRFADRSPQSLYFPESHPHPGVFKGMAVILEECGFTDAHKLRYECPKFQCPKPLHKCCCRRILYTQPDFVDATSKLEIHC
jgi:hypothetical protein